MKALGNNQSEVGPPYPHKTYDFGEKGKTRWKVISALSKVKSKRFGAYWLGGYITQDSHYQVTETLLKLA